MTETMELVDITPKENHMIIKHVSVDTQTSKLGDDIWSVARLIQLSKNFEVFDAQINCMSLSYRYPSLSLKELAGHIEAVNTADLSYPIILDEDGDIMDGRHRLMRALLNGDKTIKAVRFDCNPRPCRIED